MLVVTPAQTASFPFYFQQNGVLFDLEALSFQVFQAGDPPTQLYPAAPGQQQAIDVDAAPGREAIGEYVGTWAVPGGAVEGGYFVRWFWQVLPGGVIYTADVPFDVVTTSAIPVGPMYALPSEMREEGILATGPGSVQTARLLKAIVRASQYIEKITRRFFEARPLTVRVDGSRSGALLLEIPIVAVTSLLWSETRLTLASVPIESNSYRIYNRHLQGLTQPDDRAMPRIELYGIDNYVRSFVDGGAFFPGGKQNIQIDGVFGYTEPDGTPFGRTPDAIREATMRLAMKYAMRLGDKSAQEEASLAGRVLSESTRDQSVTYAALSSMTGSAGVGIGAFTGDPAIDSILLQYLAPPKVAVA